MPVTGTFRPEELEARPSFALLGPGFGDGEAWTLLDALEAVDPGGPADLLVAPFELALPLAFRAGARERLMQVELSDRARPLALRLDASGHAAGVRTIREAIAAGDVYQVNLTLRALLPPVPASALLARVCARGVPRFAAWVRLPDRRELVSASPELLFAVRGRSVRSEPMKGTSPLDAEAGLLASEKDKAELAMITDLVRNDLAPVCEPGSVRVLSARRLLRLPYAVQAVSEVIGTLHDGATLVEVLAALHPGGSVTGAPKAAAVAMIRAMEPSPRGLYCGALAHVDGDRAVASLLIRTAERDAGGWTFGVGGGIVWDSDPEAELREIHVKLGALG
jgi:anthranilate/para-aminobenzoate synthase component I